MGLTWHAGLSASAPLLVATPGHFLEREMGLLPLTQTIFSPFNLGLAAVVIAVFGVLVPALHPRPDRTVTAPAAALEEDDAAIDDERDGDAPAGGFAAWIDDRRALGWIAGALGAVWLFQYFGARGWMALTLNVMNFAFLMLAVTLHARPRRIVAAAEGGVRLASGVVLQFPFYAGIYGIIRGSGLANVMGDAFVAIANAKTYPLLVYWYSGLVNYFVPSGGSKWAIEAPYVLSAARTLGVEPAQVVLAYAWGDMMTDVIQPFWALPLLRAARLDFRHIAGYGMLFFVIYSFLVSVAFAIAPR
jgi:short-chain fatty acids transporter